MKKLLILLLVLSFNLSLFLSSTTSQAFTHPDDPTLSPDSFAQTQANVNSFSCDDVTDVPVSECEALVDLYLSTNGVGWKNQQECSGDEYDDCWLATTKISQWFGVTVKDGHVTIVSLYSNLLTGIIPETIGQLPYLKLLELAGNQLTGAIPESLGLLTFLEKACLTNNQLSGPIPDTLGGMTSLLNLSFNDNWIEGEIPASLGNLTTLTKFSLGNNRLSGTIPDSLGQLVNVDRFEVYKNNLSGGLPESLGNLVKLKELVINDTLLSGSIPLSFTNLSNVTAFYFFGTQLCEPTTPEFLAWKALVGIGWHGTDLICMDYHHYLPIICR